MTNELAVIPNHSVEPSMQRVAVIPWLEKPGCYLCISGKKRPTQLFGEKFYTKGAEHLEHKSIAPEDRTRTEPCISFTYVENGVAAEWDGEYGPIQLWYKAEESTDEARPHWLWPYATGLGHWSQIAVDEHDLPDSFNTGAYDHIFSVLRSFVQSRIDEP